VQAYIIRGNPAKEHLGGPIRRPTLLEVPACFPNGLLGQQIEQFGQIRSVEPGRPTLPQKLGKYSPMHRPAHQGVMFIPKQPFHPIGYPKCVRPSEPMPRHDFWRLAKRRSRRPGLKGLLQIGPIQQDRSP
jgi:hypothetical protein